MEGHAVVYLADNGFSLFTSNIMDMKLEITLTNYPTLMGIMQNQEIEGLATSKISSDKFLFAYALNLRNLDARDARLKKHTVTIVNFIVTREVYKELMLNFDEFERFLESYFQPIRFLFDLYAVDFTKILPIFLKRQRFVEKAKRNKQTEQENSLAIEFNNWLRGTDFEEENKS